MPDIFDSFKKAAFGDLEFPYVSLSIKGSLRHHVHEYLHRPGAEIESLGRRAYEFRYACQFHQDMPSWPDLYPSRLSELISLCESGQTFPLYVPNLAREVQAKGIDWPRNLTATMRSGESVDFTFLEDLGALYTADKLIGTVSRSVPVQHDNVRVLIEALQDPPALDALDAFAVELDKWLALLDGLKGDILYLPIRVDALFDAGLALSQTPILQTALGAPAMTATIAMLADIARLRNESMQSTRPFAAYTTERDKMSVVDVSMVLFGTPANAWELMQLNNLDDALSMKLGTTVRYMVPATA